MSRYRRLAETVIVLLVVIFIAYQIFASFYAAVTTEPAVFHEHSDGVELNGFVLRNEKVIIASDGGTLHFSVSDGERVSKGGVIAKVYVSDSASSAVTRIEEIETRISALEEIENYNDKNAVDMGAVNNKIISALNSFILSVSDGHFDGADEAKKDLLTYMTRKQVAMGTETDFAAAKEQLNSEKNSLLASVGQPVASVLADVSGYFVSGVDGYEDKLNIEDLSVFTPEYFENLNADKVNGNVIGKIVHDYKWYIALTMPISDSMFYKNGDKVKIRINEVDQTIETTVERINISKTNNNATLILSCSEMSSEIACIRSGKMTIVKNEYSGLRVNPKAVRVVNGVRGVYVVSGIEVKFVGINVLYSNDDYAICELNRTNDQQLRLYDEIVVKGRNLYDGKIIY